MLIIYALVLVVGILIGLTIDSFLNKKLNECNENIISILQEINKGKDDLIELHVNYCIDLEEIYNNCQEGINKTINENIDLKKKLAKANK